MLKIGILGASGFIGGRTTEFLSDRDFAEIRPIARSASGLSRLSHLGLKNYTADALDPLSLRDSFSGCDVIIYCAAGSPWFLKKTAVSTYQAAEKAGVPRLVYLSTASVHGQNPKPGTDENSPLDDRQFLAYNNAKIKAERHLLKLRETGQTEVVFLRPGIVFGPGSGWVLGFANSLQNGTAYLVNRGRGICNSIYIDNLAHAIYLATVTPDIDRQAFIVGDREQVTWADLYEPIAQIFGQSLDQIPNFDRSDYQPSFKEKLRETLRNSDLVGELMNSIKGKKTSKKSDRQMIQQPALNQEIFDLYRCEYKLPCQKAEQDLHYSPILSFQEGCDRTVEWLVGKSAS